MDDVLHQRNIARRLGQTEVIERSLLYLPWTQQILNPFPLASSGNTWGNQVQPWPVNVLAFYCSVYVSTTNNGTNFWTIVLLDDAGTTVASLSTAAIAANTLTRLSTTTITQPASTSVQLNITPTATLAPGSIYVWPAVALLRTG